MDYLLDNFKVLIGLVIAVLWVIGKISEGLKKKNEEPWTPPEEEYQPDYEPADYEESQPPPLPREWQAVPPPLPAETYVPSSEEELQRQRVMHERLNAIRKEKKDAATEIRAAKKAAKRPAAPIVSPGLQARLRNRTELRRAIVMREILDPPVGLR